MGKNEKIRKVDHWLQNHIFEFSAIYLKKIRFFHEIDDVAPFFDSKLDEKHDPIISRIPKTKQNKIEILPPKMCPLLMVSFERLDLEI